MRAAIGIQIFIDWVHVMAVPPNDNSYPGSDSGSLSSSEFEAGFRPSSDPHSSMVNRFQRDFPHTTPHYLITDHHR